MNKQKKENKYRMLVLICLFIILLLIYGGARIYALFHSELDSKVQLKKGTWNITVNESDITKGKDIKFEINNISVEGNDHVKPGTLAPGLTGNFKIAINPKNTDVSIKYEISLDGEDLKNSNLNIKEVKETLLGNELIRTGENAYTGIILLEEIKAGKNNEITIEIEWIDNEENNEIDIEIGTQDSQYKIPLTVHVCQYLGEEINAYTEN